MSKWARIEDNTVMEITNIDPAGRFHESLIWLACADQVEPGWLYVGENFSPPPEPEPPTPEELAARRMAEIKAQLAQIDMDSIRPLRAVADGTATDYDIAKLQELETQAAALRAELAELEV